MEVCPSMCPNKSPLSLLSAPWRCSDLSTTPMCWNDMAFSKGSCERAHLQGEKQNTPTTPCKLVSTSTSLSGAQKQGSYGRRGGEGGWMAGAERIVAALAWQSSSCRRSLPAAGVAALQKAARATGGIVTSQCLLRPTGADCLAAFAVPLWRRPRITDPVSLRPYQ